MTPTLKKLLFFGVVLYLILLGAIIYERYRLLTNDQTASQTESNPIQIDQGTPLPQEATPQEETLPESVRMETPFLSQAPFGIWDDLHQETCEEASLMMVHYFRQKKEFLSLQQANLELVDLVTWQSARGYKVDVAVAELAEIARGYYGLATGRVIVDPTVDQIKKELAGGRPVIVPAAGRELPNPYFTPPGPRYHMVVIKGYDAAGFIVNDPGTRRGKDFRYNYDDLMRAMHDWNQDDINLGRKAVLVFD